MTVQRHPTPPLRALSKQPAACQDWNKKNKKNLAYQFERLGVYPTVLIVNHNDRGEQLIKL
jgi:hypothetical protein